MRGEDKCIQYNVGLIPLISLTSLSVSHSTYHRRKRWENYLSYPGSSSLRLINRSNLHLVLMLWCIFSGCANWSSLWVDLHVPVQKLLFGRKGQGQAFPWRRCSADGRALLTRLIYLWRIQGIHWGFGTAVRVLKEEQKIVFFVHTVQRQWITQTPLLLVIFLKNKTVLYPVNVN